MSSRQRRDERDEDVTQQIQLAKEGVDEATRASTEALKRLKSSIPPGANTSAESEPEPESEPESLEEDKTTAREAEKDGED